ncbi:type I polyketide synthase [Chryseobacterium gregarium]|uniref:type I polyketide synthase n=1 Tax=Chryseobacterium gregarium TaxID=456299 RepID=UPI000427484D|nr:type I polyketide synthase [Chryseobacterium gregarium]
MQRESLKRDIAIIGVSCMFSGCDNPHTFWEKLANGNELIEFYTDQELVESGIEPKLIQDPNYVKVKTFIDHSDAFDYTFFGYTKDEANSMDPQIRILHQLVWEAFEDSCYDPSKIQDKVGVYLTAPDNFNWIAHTTINKKDTVDPFYLSQINNKNFCSSLISYNLNLKGPSIFMDTACSSSLVAMHTACRALLLRECSMAVAGGIALNTKDEKGYIYEEGMISSKDGHCRAFDEDSSGTVTTEGGGVVVLKRLEDALNDNDHIYAIVRATAVNNDGKRKVGYTAPSISGQSDCIKQAHNFAKVSLDEISYIETHGTGTKLGDPIEIEALNKSFNYDQSLKCAIGAVKSNLGHTGNAAGIAGIIKTALSLENKVIPPSLHYVKPNSEISFSKGPFYVNTQAKQWETKDNRPLIAGVSSFGIGGTNAHAILENFVADHSSDYRDKQVNNVITYSAKRPEAVRQYFTKLKKFITENKRINLSDLSYSLNTGRAQFDYRNTIVFKDREDLLNELETKKDFYQKAKSSQQIVFVFPGQGAQYFKMGEQLYHQEEGFKQYIDEGLLILKNKFNADYSQVLGYGSTQTSDPLKINETQYTQPLLFLIEYALAKFLIELGIKPSLMIGHSLGEYVAACISGVLSFEDGLLLVAERALLMSKIPTGKMAAINASFEQIKNEITDKVSVAAVNSDHTTVLSGTEEDIQECINIFNEKNITTTLLKTSHAFHSRMMNDIAADFENLFSDIQLSAPEIPYISNLTANFISGDEAKSPQYWREQMLNTVLFEKGIKNILKDPKDYIFIELGPSTLTNAIKQNEFYNDNTIIRLLQRSGQNEELQFLNKALGELWQSGIEIDWRTYYQNQKRKKISLPTYAFEKNKLDFHVNPFKRFTVDNNPSSLDLFYQKRWKNSQLSKGAKEEKATFIIFSENSFVSQSILHELENRDISFIELEKNEFFKANGEIDLGSITDYLDKINTTDRTNYQIIFTWNIQDDQLSSMVSVFRLFNIIGKFLISSDLTLNSKITLIGDFSNMEVNANSNTTLLSSFGQLYVCAQENKNIFSFLLDIPSGNDLPYGKIIDEIEYNFSDPFVTYKGDQRYVPFYERWSEEKGDVQLDSKVIVVIGGSGKIGKILTGYLLENKAKVVVVGRKSIDQLDEGFRNRIGNEVSYFTSDISDLASLESTITRIEQEYGKIHGVLNLAGNPSNDSLKLVEHLDMEAIQDQLSPKVQGIINLYEVFSVKKLDFVWITSSLSAILGGQTFGAYSVANSYMDYYIGKSKPQNWVSVNLDGISDRAINEAKLIEIFKTTLSSNGQNHQIIASAKNPNQHLTYAYKTNNNPVDPISTNNLYSTGYVGPVSAMEIKLCDVFNSFFEPKKVGTTDNFFELGGDSLKAMTILKNINKEFDLELTPQDLYTSPTIKGLALHIEMISYVSKTEVSNEPNRKIIII